MESINRKQNAGARIGTIETPCRRDCPDRCAVPNCHTNCEKYLAWKKLLNEINQKEANKNLFTNYECERRLKIAKIMAGRRR